MPRKQLSVGSNILNSNTKTFIQRRVEDKATDESIFAQYQAIWAGSASDATGTSRTAENSTQPRPSQVSRGVVGQEEPGRKVVRQKLNIALELSKAENRVEMKRVCSLPVQDDAMLSELSSQQARTMPLNESENQNPEDLKQAPCHAQATERKVRLGLKQLLSAQLSNSMMRGVGTRDHSASRSTSVCSSTQEDQSLVLSRSVCN